MTWKEDWQLLRDLNREMRREKAARKRQWWNNFREKIARALAPSHLEFVQVVEEGDFEPPQNLLGPAEVQKHVAKGRIEARSTSTRAPDLIGEEPMSLKDFGLGTAWVAEHKSGLGGLGGCRGRVYTKGFSADHLYVFDTSNAAQEFIRRMGCQHTHYSVCHQWSPGPPLKWKTQWGGNTRNA